MKVYESVQHYTTHVRKLKKKKAFAKVNVHCEREKANSRGLGVKSFPWASSLGQSITSRSSRPSTELIISLNLATVKSVSPPRSLKFLTLGLEERAGTTASPSDEFIRSRLVRLGKLDAQSSADQVIKVSSTRSLTFGHAAPNSQKAAFTIACAASSLPRASTPNDTPSANDTQLILWDTSSMMRFGLITGTGGCWRDTRQ